jgi:hypothetical protein
MNMRMHTHNTNMNMVLGMQSLQYMQHVVFPTRTRCRHLVLCCAVSCCGVGVRDASSAKPTGCMVWHCCRFAN